MSFQVDAAGESDFVAIDKGVTCSVFQLRHQRAEGGVADVRLIGVSQLADDFAQGLALET